MAQLESQSRATAGLKNYLFPFTMPDGTPGHVYLMCPCVHEQELRLTLQKGEIPEFATVLACGHGQPDERLRHHLERYYGHIYEQEAA